MEKDQRKGIKTNERFINRLGEYQILLSVLKISVDLRLEIQPALIPNLLPWWTCLTMKRGKKNVFQERALGKKDILKFLGFPPNQQMRTEWIVLINHSIIQQYPGCLFWQQLQEKVYCISQCKVVQYHRTLAQVHLIHFVFWRFMFQTSEKKEISFWV